MSTFWQLLQRTLSQQPSQPVVTYYDLRPGLETSEERVELSAVTYANWVAKTANLLIDEYDVEPGDLIYLSLPTHWLTPVWLGAAWTVGACVTTQPGSGAQLSVLGPEVLADAVLPEGAVLACALRPMAARFTQPLPSGAEDFSAVVWSQPDGFIGLPETDPDAVALKTPTTFLTQGEVLDRGQATQERVLTTTNPAHTEGLAAFVGPLGAGVGTVWVRGGDAAGLSALAAAERATLLG